MERCVFFPIKASLYSQSCVPERDFEFSGLDEYSNQFL